MAHQPPPYGGGVGGGAPPATGAAAAGYPPPQQQQYAGYPPAQQQQQQQAYAGYGYPPQASTVDLRPQQYGSGAPAAAAPVATSYQQPYPQHHHAQQPPAYTSVPPPSAAPSTGLDARAAAAVARAKAAAAAAAAAAKAATAARPAAAAAAAPAQQQQPQGVPPSLTAYVARALGSCRTPADREAMKAALMAVARDARATGALWTTDWDRRPLPQLDGVAAAAAPAPQQQQQWQQQQQQQQQQPSYAAAGYPPPQAAPPPYQQQQPQPQPPASASYPPHPSPQQQQQYQQYYQQHQQQHAAYGGGAGASAAAATAAAAGNKRPRPQQQPQQQQQQPFSDYPSLPRLPPQQQQYNQQQPQPLQQQQPTPTSKKAAKKAAARAAQAEAAARAAAALTLSAGSGGGGGGGVSARRGFGPPPYQQQQQFSALSGGGGGDDDGVLSPEERAKRARRAGRFGLAADDDAGGGGSAGGWPSSSGFDEGASSRGARYGGHPDRWAAQASRRAAIQRALQKAQERGGGVSAEDAAERFTVRGTCERLEKSYLRLTSAPNPAEVRPPRVLEAALKRCIEMAAAGPTAEVAAAGGAGGGGAGGGGSGNANLNRRPSPAPSSSAALNLPSHQQSAAALYFYLNDQFKAIRQDCTVQRLRGGLAVRAYEAHARAALEYGDVGEFNACQGQLALLHAEALAAAAAAAGGGEKGGGRGATAGRGGKGKKGGPAAAAGGNSNSNSNNIDPWSDPPDASVCSVAEFAAYKVLYHAVYAQHGEAKGITGAVRSAVECWTDDWSEGAEVSSLARLVGRPVAVALVRQAAAAVENGSSSSSFSTTTIPSILQASGAPDSLLPASVSNALRARAALARSDPLAFCAAYRTAPALGRALLDVALPRLRFSVLQSLVRAFRPGPLPIEALSRLLGFWDPAVGNRRRRRTEREAKDAAAVKPLPGCRAVVFEGDGEGAASVEEACAACLEWARAHGAVLVPLDEAGVAAAAGVPPPAPAGASKKARAAAAAALAAAEAARAAAIAAVPAELMAVDTRASSAPGVLSVPEDTTKVAHGDANLNIEGFLAKALGGD